MGTKKDRRPLLRRRMGELREWFIDTLRGCELRTGPDIAAAMESYWRWATKNDDGDEMGALLGAWGRHESMTLPWAASAARIAQDIPGLSASPAWELGELDLIAGLAFIMTAETEGADSAAATMLYADAVCARDWWLATRGITRCRNQDTKSGKLLREIHAENKAREMAQARSAAATKAAEARRTKDLDGKQAAKISVRALFDKWQAGKLARLRLHSDARFAQYAMRETGGVLESEATICRWVREWRKEADAAMKA